MTHQTEDNDLIKTYTEEEIDDMIEAMKADPSNYSYNENGKKRMTNITSKDDPRYIKMRMGTAKYNQSLKDRKERKIAYKDQVQSIKQMELSKVHMAIANGTQKSPAEALLNMMRNQEVFMNDPNTTPNQLHKERALYLDMYKQYAALTGVNAPNTQAVEMEVEESSEMTSDEVQAKLMKFVEGKAIDVTPKE